MHLAADSCQVTSCWPETTDPWHVSSTGNHTNMVAGFPPQVKQGSPTWMPKPFCNLTSEAASQHLAPLVEPSHERSRNTQREEVTQRPKHQKPGITGVTLRGCLTKKAVWGQSFNFVPHGPVSSFSAGHTSLGKSHLVFNPSFEVQNTWKNCPVASPSILTLAIQSRSCHLLLLVLHNHRNEH